MRGNLCSNVKMLCLNDQITMINDEKTFERCQNILKIICLKDNLFLFIIVYLQVLSFNNTDVKNDKLTLSPLSVYSAVLPFGCYCTGRHEK